MEMLSSDSWSEASPAALELLTVLRDGRPRSRARLAEHAGVARSTASARVEELRAEGLVVELSDTVYTGGRPSKRISIVPRSRVVIAADIGATHADVALVDLTGAPIERVSRSISSDDEPDTILSWLKTCALQLAETETIPAAAIIGAGIGLAAPIDHATGRPINPPIMPRWNDFDIRSWFVDNLGIAATVEKDVNMMAVGECRLRGAAAANLIFVKASTGIGAGITSEGRLHRGQQGTAGDIGHIALRRDTSTPCQCGNLGCVEAIAGVPALARRLSELGHALNSNQDVIDLVSQGNIDAIQAVRQAGRDIGEVLAHCVSVLNPSMIVIGGSLSHAGRHLLAGVREVVHAQAMPFSTQQLEIVRADPSTMAAITGAAALAIDRLLTTAQVSPE